jgi:hypothetical protein
MPPDGSPDHAVVAPTPPLRPFVSHYAGSRMRDVPHREHTGLPPVHRSHHQPWTKCSCGGYDPSRCPLPWRGPGADWRSVMDAWPFMSSRAIPVSVGDTSGSASCPGFGIAPKAAAWVFRFEHACRMFLRSRRRIADVAVASGFHDQAHMVREWHALARLLTP